jgi:hypothetical protein
MAKCNDCLHCEVCKKYGTTVDFDVDDGVCLYYEKKVVRCKDCHWWRNINKKNGCGICNHEVFYIDDPTTAPVTDPNDFCSYGERKEDG